MSKQNSQSTSAKKMETPPAGAMASHAAYDEVPYTSHAFPQTNPLLLQGVAALFGLIAPDPQTARVLEIGCASGGNIMAFAACNPKSQCVGIDYSQKQIDLGRKDVNALGLHNLKLKHMSVMDITKEFGEFDYIICHGVLSWVSPEVQNKIMEVCKTNLSQDGIAYVSYNTLPGWNSVRSLRDIMLYHTAQYADPMVKVQQARWLLQFLSESNKNNKSALANTIEREIGLLANQPDYYLLHDHLEENNYGFYFHEFMSKAQAQGLQYLADTSIESMFSGNLPEETAKVLATSNDIVRTEQYMDYICDRRFRQTMLCHSDRILTRNVSSQVLINGVVVSKFNYPEGFAEYDLSNAQSFAFASMAALTLTTDDPVLLAALKVLSEIKKQPIRVADLIKRAKAKIDASSRKFSAEEMKTLDGRIEYALMRFIFVGGIQFYLGEPFYAAKVSLKPETSALTRYQAEHYNWVSSQKQETVWMDAFGKLLLKELDGTHGIEALVDTLMPHFESKTIVFNEHNKPVDNMLVVRQKLPAIIAERLEFFADLALLVK